MLIDVHAHYDDRRYDADRDETITAALRSGVDAIINSGSSIKSSKASVELAEKYDCVYASVGIHPHAAETAPENTLDVLAGLLKNKKAVAVGEIGLDFHYDFSARESQRRWFEKQMAFAAEIRYPVVIHDREAHAECLDMAKRYKGVLKGVFHCYAGSPEMAGELAGLGYMMSFGGVATFKNAKDCRETIKALPLEYILLETDCPYLAPHPYRGRRNDSGYLPLIAQSIAGLKNITAEEVVAKTGENAARCFGIPPGVRANAQI
ncbi:MAG: TatD family hydrolase [Oscillospiraceae bacterium]|nr:TatD family hydrolase [Oscillospiraceae bacterium]